MLWIGSGGGTNVDTYDTVAAGSLGGDVRLILDEPGVQGTTVAGEYYFLGRDAPGSDFEKELWRLQPGGEPQLLGTATTSGYALAPHGDVAVVSKADLERGDLGVWALTLAGGQARAVIPSGATYRHGLAATPDARLVASGRCPVVEGPVAPMQLVRDGRLTELRLAGTPIGFDRGGSLIFWEGCDSTTVARLSPDGTAEPLAEGATQARVTPGGRTLVTFHENDAGLGQELRFLDLDTNESWSKSLDGLWLITALGEDDFILLEGHFRNDTRWRLLVASINDRWIGAMESLPTVRR